MSEFGRVCERKKFRVNVGDSKVMRCSSFGNWGRMHVRLNDEPFNQVDCIKDLGSPVVVADGRCVWDEVQRINELNMGVLKGVLNNRGLEINGKKCLYEGVIVRTALYGAEAWDMRSAERRKVNVLEINV